MYFYNFLLPTLHQVSLVLLKTSLPKDEWCSKLKSAGKRHQILDPTPEYLNTFGIDSCGSILHPQQVNVHETLCPLSDAFKQRFVDCVQLM